MQRILVSILATALATLPSCAAEQKGEEDDLPADGKLDSFQAPTDHGTLVFGVPSNAKFTAEEGFHSWTFKLSAPAQVNLETVLGGTNLDTVMYLYARTSSTAGWGAYIERNDDAHEDTSASQLELELDEGEYRVLVKAYKRTQRGSFALEGQCVGDGCPPAGATCAAPLELPVDRGFGGSCSMTIAAIFDSGRIGASSAISISGAERCTLPELERKAVDYYLSYFAEFSPVEEDASLDVETTRLAAGTLIDVTDGGDESAMSMVFDADGALVLLYQHNQSPDLRFYCRQPIQPVKDVPNIEACISNLVVSVPHASTDESVVNLTAAPNNLPTGLAAEVAGPIRHYAAMHGTALSTTLTTQGATWQAWGEPASWLKIKASTKPRTSYLATRDLILLEATDGDPSQLVCE